MRVGFHYRRSRLRIAEQEEPGGSQARTGGALVDIGEERHAMRGQRCLQPENGRL